MHHHVLVLVSIGIGEWLVWQTTSRVITAERENCVDNDGIGWNGLNQNRI